MELSSEMLSIYLLNRQATFALGAQYRFVGGVEQLADHANFGA
jgi:hypothetical protein